MKYKIAIISILVCLKTFAQAPIQCVDDHIQGAAFFPKYGKTTFDQANQSIVISDITYGGGCADHRFSLKLESCQAQASKKYECHLTLIDEHHADGCEAIQFDNYVSVPLETMGLADPKYKGAILILTAGVDWYDDPMPTTCHFIGCCARKKTTQTVIIN